MCILYAHILDRFFQRHTQTFTTVPIMRLHILLIFFLLRVFFQAQAQSPAPHPREISGRPIATALSLQQTDRQFWDGCEDEKGVVYLGNNDGALVYDGERWQKVRTPNGSAVRCLATDARGRVLAGAYGEFGEIVPDGKGGYRFCSWASRLQQPASRLGDIWDIHPMGETIVLRTPHYLVLLKGQSAQLISCRNYFESSFLLRDTLYVQDQHEGLFCLQDQQLRKLVDDKALGGKRLMAMLGKQGEAHRHLLTEDGKLYRWQPAQGSVQPEASLLPAGEAVTCALRQGKQLLVGTLSRGLLAYDLQQQRMRSGPVADHLPAETIHNMLLNRQGNLWLLLNNGLRFVQMRPSIQTLFEQASVYDLHMDEGRMTLATNQGLYTAPLIAEGGRGLQLGAFQKIAGSEGQVWSLGAHAGKLYASHDKGLFVLQGDKAHHLDGPTGIWRIEPLAGDSLLACSYEGMYLMKGERLLHKVQGFEESVRDILPAEAPHTYWICHGYKGVYRIRFNEGYTRVLSTEQFGEAHGLPSIYNINAHRWQGQTIFSTNAGLYIFREQDRRFILHQPLTDRLGKTQNIRQLLGRGSRSWFIQDDALGYFDKGRPGLHTDPFLPLKGSFNRSMELIRPLSEQQVAIGTREGLFLADLRAHVPIADVQASVVALSAGGERLPLDSLEIGPSAGPLLLHFACPKLMDLGAVKYRYRLQGGEEQWSEWSETPELTLHYLPAGNYALQLQAQGSNGQVAEARPLPFSVLPSWYLRWWALMAWALMLAVLGYWSVRKLRAHQHAKEEKIRQRAAKEKKLLELEIEQLRLAQEKQQVEQVKEALEEDVRYQSKELANHSVLLLQKQQLLGEVRQELASLHKKVEEEPLRKRISRLMQTIGNQLKEEAPVQQLFDAEFERIHQEFFRSLQAAYPDLTGRELRLCAFIKMDMTNKDIAPLLGISVRGVETARYRLRKKLQLEQDEGMGAFFRQHFAEEKTLFP